MIPIRYIFFGSTSDSVLVLEKLCQVSRVMCQAVITQPERPAGRKQILTPTPVEIWAKQHNITVLTFPSDTDKPWLYADENQVIDTLQPLKADLFISASYGQRIPMQAIQAASFGGLNIHPSLLPRWRGADPVPWAILSGDHQTGVTIVTLSESFDKGRIIAQKKIPITDQDTSNPLRTKLFTLGADLLVKSLASYTSDVKAALHIGCVKLNTHSYARRLTRDDGFIPWEILQPAMDGQDVPNEHRPKILSLVTCHLSLAITRALRALSPWPGIWTNIQLKTEEKRLKILSVHLQPTTYNLQLDTVQLEGKKSVTFDQFKKAYLSHIPS